MNSYAELLIQRFAGRGLLLDTNLLLLYVIGRFDISLVGTDRFDRISAYSAEDFRLLENLLLLFRTTMTTPHVLAEVSNWIGYLSSAQEQACLRFLSNLIPSFTELFQTSAVVSQHTQFHFLGLTDTALAFAADENLIVTDDARFVHHLNLIGLEALNINHLRQLSWLAE